MTDKERIVKAHKDSGLVCELLLATKETYPVFEDTTHLFRVYPMNSEFNSNANMYAEYEFNIKGVLNGYNFYEN